MKAASVILDPEQSASYYPDEPKKSKVRIAAELFHDAFLTAAVDDTYFIFGRDTIRVGSKRFPPMGYLMDIIHRQVKERGKEQAALLNNKLEFASFMERCGFPSPSIIGRTKAGRIIDGNGAPLDLNAVLEAVDGQMFLKPADGSGGRGAVRVEVRDGKTFVGATALASEELPNVLGSGLLVQSVVRQHTRMESFHAASLNTVRLVTALVDEHAQVLGSFLRIGTGGAATDNFAGSGIAVPIDRESGNLIAPGFCRDVSRGRPVVHPDSGVSFEDFEIPYYQEACEVACRVHERLGGLVTIGWDVAITPDGPTIIEGNVYWWPRMHIAGDPTFLSRYSAIVAPWLRDRDRSWVRVN